MGPEPPLAVSTPVVSAQGQVRGTQTFVGVMVLVWRHPLWTLREIVWRWSFGVCALGLCGVAFASALAKMADPATAMAAGAPAGVHGGLGGGLNALANLKMGLNLMDPLGSVERLGNFLALLLPQLARWAWVLPVLAVLWIALATVGRAAVARRFGPELRPRYGALALWQAARLLAFVALCAAWCVLLWADARLAIARPVLRGDEPNLVLYFALAVVATLALFVLWSVCSWRLRGAALTAMAGSQAARLGSQRVLGTASLRSRLVEINLVMGIVRVALVVLLMVFSATPLPFQSFTTPAFLGTWTLAMTVVYLVLSDYFHVVHAAAYYELWNFFRGLEKS